MFGGRRRRIAGLERRVAELEGELQHTRVNLAVAVVNHGPFGFQRIIVEKGQWYSVSYKFLHTGAPNLQVADLVVTQHDGASYFDGSPG